LFRHISGIREKAQDVTDFLSRRLNGTGQALLSGGQLCEQHLASLDNAYYERGQARLKRLAEWSRGRISKK
jgi:hypothetical protein